MSWLIPHQGEFASPKLKTERLNSHYQGLPEVKEKHFKFV